MGGVGRDRAAATGALVTYDYRVKLTRTSDGAAWVARGARQFPDAGWQVRTANEASPALQRFIDPHRAVSRLVAITALLVGGIGIASAVSYFIAGKTATIATLKSLGAPNHLVFAVYAAQIGMLALAGVAIGLFARTRCAAGGSARSSAKLLPVPLRLGPT